MSYDPDAPLRKCDRPGCPYSFRTTSAQQTTCWDCRASALAESTPPDPDPNEED